MLRSVSAPSVVPSPEINRTKIRSPEQKFGIVARALWPHKTAAELAVRTGVTQRTAEFWLAGREPSARAIAVIVNELLPSTTTESL